MAIQREIWISLIVANLFKDNMFVRIAQNHDQYVYNGKIVHIPQAGAVPEVQKNRTVFPATAERRTDTDITYNLDEFTSTPTHIQDAETVELSYDKTMSVLQEHLEIINEKAADDILYRWALGLPTTNMIATTGDAVATHLDGATGNRKLFVKENLKAMQLAFNRQNIPKADRFALFDSDMLGQLQDDPDLKKRDGISGGELDLKNGIITRLYGFNIMERSDVVRLNGDTVLAPGVANAAASNAGVFCWQKNAVATALGDVNFFERINDPLYYGSVYSALIRTGGRRYRQDNKGVGFIRQAASA